MKTVPELIKSKREEKNYSQEYVADKLNITSRAYQNYEADREPKLDTLRKIAEILDVSVHELLDEQYVPNSYSQQPVSLDTIAEKIETMHSHLFGHIVRSAERYAKEDGKKSDAEMDRINRYAEQFRLKGA